MKKEKFDISARFTEVEKLKVEYLRELNGLSKILLSFSIAILGLTISFWGPYLNIYSDQKYLVLWAWLFFFITPIIGVIEIFFSSNRFKAEAKRSYLYLMQDSVVQCNGSKEKLDEFCWKAYEAERSSIHWYNLCELFVKMEILFVLAAFILLAFFVYFVF